MSRHVRFSHLFFPIPSVPLPFNFEEESPHADFTYDIQTFRRPSSRPPPVRTTSAPQYQRRTPSMVWTMCDGWILSSLLLFSLDAFYYEQPLDDINHVFVTHVFLDVFIYNLLVAFLHHLDYVPPLLHASRSTLTPSLPIYYLDMMDRSYPLHCYTFFVLLNLVFFGIFFFLAVETLKTLWISLFLHLWEGPLFCSFSFLSLSFHYLPPTFCRFMGPSISHRLEVLFFFFFLRLRIWLYITFYRFLFFSFAIF